MLAAVETGGTKLIARLVAPDGAVVDERRWPTADSAQAFADLAAFLDGRGVRAIGIAAFGPLILDPADLRFGEVLPTTKPGWTGTNLRAALAERFAVPVAIETDVNAAALAEQQLGAGRGCRTVAYVTVGTGIGGGLAHAGEALHGTMHPEIGHLPAIRAADDAFRSMCRFHPSCAEGLASGPAVRARLGGGDLGDHPDTLALIADYLAQLAFSVTLAWAPDRIVLGGGVLSAPGLLAAIRARLPDKIAGFGVAPAVAAPDYLAPAALADAGLEGALVMARALGR